jgi:lipoate-protein ligase B
MRDKKIKIVDSGLIDYAQALELQLQLLKDRQSDKIANTVLLLEHPAVITLGARKSENKLIATEEYLLSQKIMLESAGRGGGTTAHNPGQIVLYPIIKLKSIGLGVNEYVRSLEAIGIELLKMLDVGSGRRKGLPGLWIGEKKIASIGVQVKKWTTMHGMAINICNDLSIFENIVPCGLDDVEMTSVLKETSKKWEMSKVKEMLAEICDRFWSNTKGVF